MTDVRKFTLNTDFPLDQIIYLDSGSFVIPSGGGLGSTSTVAHGLTFKPLMVVNWSLNSDFSTTKECNLPNFEGTDPYAIRVDNVSNATNLVISGFNPTASNVTAHWRAYGFMPSNVNVDATYTASLADTFGFNTDYNYAKLWYNDIITTNPTTITHDFGYRSQVMAWSDNGTSTAQLNTFGSVEVTTTSVIVTSASNVHLRIYGDSQL
jgi:hypothetical protein